MNVDSLRSPQAALPLPPGPHALPRSVVLRAVGAHAGMALFGLAMAVSGPGGAGAVLTWALLLPVLLAGTWLVCLPALYIPWAGREEAVRLSPVLRAAGASFSTAGSCLGATAPILWFFAATAPRSAVGPALGFVFGWCALVAAGVTFGRALREQALVLPGAALVGFFALFTLTFFQFSGAAGLAWF